MKRLKKLGLYGLLWSLSVYPVYCYGVGLGNIQVNTHLNQPLQAIIPLHTLNDVSPTEIKVRLADTAAFEKAGLDRPFYLTEIDFKVVEQDNQTFIEISSAAPIQDPFLSFVLEANWASGRILREYTILLDPPSKENVQLAQKPKAKVVPIPRATEQAKKESSETFGPVGPEHTLWNIATVVSSKTGGDIHQSVMALAKKNPQAFIGGNINKLRKGATLQLPTKAEVFQLSISEAIVQVKDLITEAKVLLKPQQELAKPVENRRETQQAVPEKPLKLIVPDTSTVSLEKKDLPSLNMAQMDAFQDRLLLIEEALDSLKRANHTLQFEQDELIGQNQTLLDMLNQKDEEISLLKQKLASVQSLDPTQNIQTPSTQKIQMETQAPEPVPAKFVQAEPTTEKTKLEPSVPDSKPAPPPVTSTTQVPSPGEMWSLRNFLITLLILGGLSALGYELYRRKLIPNFRAKKEEESERFQPVKVETQITEQSTPAKTTKEEIEQAFSVFEEGELKKDVKQADAKLQEKQDVTHILEEHNVLAEADVYIAYERYDNAEQILKSFLEKHPGEIEAHIKLLELYKILGALDKVKAHIQEVGLWLSKNDKEGWQRIQDWQEQTQNAEKLLAKNKGKNIPENAQPEIKEPDTSDVSSQDFHLDEPQNGSKKQDATEAAPEFDLKKEYTLQLEPKQAGKSEHPEDKKHHKNESVQAPRSLSANEKSAIPDQDSMETKLAVAQAYLDLGDMAGAKAHLQEVLEKGNIREKQKAEQLLKEIKE